jgi:release factor glutamine methyltransferase
VSGAVAAGTVAEALAAASDALDAADVDTPRLDAEVMLAEAMGVSTSALRAGSEGGVSPAAAREFGAMVRRRVQREPVAYIVGRRWFRRIQVHVDQRVLIPRPETELLVEMAVEVQPKTVLDIGTGSGAVALAIADELSHVSVRGTDTSAAALEVARANAERLGLTDRCEFAAADASSSRYATTSRNWDLVVANLPYVPDGDWQRLQPEIRNFEPREAVLGGPDGLDHIRGLLASPPDCHAIALEVGMGQAEAVEKLVEAAGFGSLERRKDLAGIDRVVIGRSR